MDSARTHRGDMTDNTTERPKFVFFQASSNQRENLPTPELETTSKLEPKSEIETYRRLVIETNDTILRHLSLLIKLNVEKQLRDANFLYEGLPRSVLYLEKITFPNFPIVPPVPGSLFRERFTSRKPFVHTEKRIQCLSLPVSFSDLILQGDIFPYIIKRLCETITENQHRDNAEALAKQPQCPHCTIIKIETKLANSRANDPAYLKERDEIWENLRRAYEEEREEKKMGIISCQSAEWKLRQNICLLPWDIEVQRLCFYERSDASDSLHLELRWKTFSFT